MAAPEEEPGIAPWPTRRSRRLGTFPIFSLRVDTRTSPRTGRDLDFYVLESRDWVNVVARTRRGALVMIRQFRHGSGAVELEIPGGAIDPADPDPVAAGIRELREETGYEGSRGRVIGSVRPNPAFLDNNCYTVLVEDCALARRPSPDQGEDIATRLMDLRQVRSAIAQGAISHALVIAAFHHLEFSPLAREGAS